MARAFEKLFGYLVGMACVSICQALDMVMFEFGFERDAEGDSEKRPVNLSLHIQCSWRLAQHDRIIMGCDDYRRPGRVRREDDSSLLTERIVAFAEPGRGTLVVVRAERCPAGRLVVEFQDGYRLDVLPTTSVEDPDWEFWRLIVGNEETRVHFVFRPGGLTV